MFEATEGQPISDPARAALIDTELAQVVGLARAGDGLAFRDLFQKYNGQVCTYLARLVGNDEVGRDLAQETFVRVWKSLPAIRSDAHFKAWLFRIATNIAMSHLRHARLVRWLPWREEEIVTSHIDLSIAGPEEHAGEAECVQYALAQLAPQCRTCLLLQLVAGFSQREIADSLGISEKSVSAYVSRGREQFRRAYTHAKGAIE
ncbi:MAG TPA: sigma-70 family RNA polymerase sigma factor [Ktedonobacteraceae bacterium]